MRRALLTVLLILLAAPVVLAQGARTNEAAIALERRLLALDLISLRELRQREETARTRLGESLGRLDRALAADSVTLGGLEALDEDVAASRAVEHIAAERVDHQVEQIRERLRRLAVLGEGSDRRSRDPVSGRWRVQVGPGDHLGSFDLRLNATAVTGRYQMDDGTSGSLRGTYVGGVLTLGRTDAQGGTDRTFAGTVDEAAGTVTGLWQARDLANNQPTSGGWTGARASGSTR